MSFASMQTRETIETQAQRDLREHNEKQAAETLRKNAEFAAEMRRVLDAVVEQPEVKDCAYNNGVITVELVDGGKARVYVSLERSKVKTGYHRWSYEYIGPWCINIGDYGEKTRMGGGKNGLNHDKVAREITIRAIGRVEKLKARDELAEKLEVSRKAAQRLVGDRDPYAGPIRVSSQYGCLNFTVACNEEQAAQLISLWNQIK